MGEEGAEAAREAVRRVYELRVDRSGAGERLDVYVARRVGALTRSSVKKLAQKGAVFVDGATASANTRLKAGQTIRIEVEARRRRLKPWNLPVEILYEDDYLLALNKPAGVAVHPSDTLDEPTLVEALIALRPEVKRVGPEMRSGLIHRLDKETSGVLLVAKERQFQMEMMRLFQSHRVAKYYVAVVSGVPRSRSGVVDAFIARHPIYRQRFAVSHEGGRRSVTRWRLVRAYGNRFALILAKPITGRTHQVRVHMRHLGTPVLCDKLYSSRKVIYASEIEGAKRRAGETPLIERQALHARSIAFVHPRLGKFIRLKAEMPDDLRRLLEVLNRAFPAVNE